MRTSRVGAGTEHRQANLLVPAGSHLFGLAVARHIITVPAIAGLAHEDVVGRMAPTIQGYLTGPQPIRVNGRSRETCSARAREISVRRRRPSSESRASACVCEREPALAFARW